MASTIRAAACHVSPIFLNARKTTDKAIALIKQAASHKANLVVFPETYISAFPTWSAVRPPTENHELFQRMVRESIYADGEEIDSIREAARSSGTLVSLGFSEKSRHSNACLFNSNVIIGTNGEILVHHRKLVPTFFEKLTWSPGDAHGLRVADTPYGRIGGLICGENTNPLARYVLMAQAEQIHISSWPPIWPTRALQTMQRSEKNLSGSTKVKGINYDNLAANRTRAAAHCFEAKCFGIVCAGHLGADAIETVVDGASQPDAVAETLRGMPQAATFFLDPTGAPLPSFTFKENADKQNIDCLQKEEDVLYADMDLGDCVEGKQYHDVVGGYQRMDIFDLKVDRSRRHPVKFIEQEAGAEL
jgi:nitrilase